MSSDEKNDDSLGVVFKNTPGEDRKGLSMDAPLTRGKPKEKSILSNSEDVFDIGHAFKGSGDVEKGTIVTDKRHVHMSFGEMVKSAFAEWYGKTSAALKNVELLKKQEPVTIASPESRKEVIKEAASFTKQVPKDDHTIIVEKLKTLNQDAARITGRSFLLKKTEEHEAVKNGYESVQEQPETRGPAVIHAQEAQKKEKTLDLRTLGIAPDVGKTHVIEKPEPAKAASHDSAPVVPAVRTMPKEALTTPEIPENVSIKKAPDVIPENLPGIVHANTASPDDEKKDGSGWSFLLKEVEEPQKPVNVSFPEWNVGKRVTEVLASPAMSPEEAARKEHDRLIREAAEKEEAERQRAEAERIKEAKRREEARRAQAEQEAAAARQAEEARMRAAQARVTASLQREQKKVAAAEEESVQALETLSSPPNTAKIPTRVFVAVGSIVVGVIAGVGAAFLVTGRDTETLQQTPSLVSADAEVESSLGASRSVFLGSLVRAVEEAPKGITHIVVREASGSAITPATFFNSTGARVSGSFVRSLDAQMMLGSVSVPENEPFIIFKTNSFDSAFAGMLAWELRMREDLAPLFGEPEPPPGPLSGEDVSRPAFVDATTENGLIRILRNRGGEEVLMYAFVNRTTVIITATTEALSAILPKIR